MIIWKKQRTLFYAAEETFVQECEVLRQELQEHELKIEGEFVSKQDMKDKLELSERLDSKTYGSLLTIIFRKSNKTTEHTFDS